MIKSKKIGFILLSIFSGITIISASAVIIYFVLNKSTKKLKSNYIFNSDNYKTITGLNSHAIPQYNSQEFLNALKIDAHQKASSDSTIIYNITWSAIQHKLAFVTHIIEILNLNQNKKIIIMNDKNLVNLDFINLTKYPNVQIKLQDNSSNLDNIDNVVNEIILLNSKNIKVDYYSDDYKFFLLL